MSDRALHDHLRSRLNLAVELSGETQAEVARRSGIPKSTLHHQLSGGGITVDVVWGVSRATGHPVKWFFPEAPGRAIPKAKMPEVIARVEAALNSGRKR